MHLAPKYLELNFQILKGSLESLQNEIQIFLESAERTNKLLNHALRQPNAENSKNVIKCYEYFTSCMYNITRTTGTLKEQLQINNVEKSDPDLIFHKMFKFFKLIGHDPGDFGSSGPKILDVGEIDIKTEILESNKCLPKAMALDEDKATVVKPIKTSSESLKIPDPPPVNLPRSDLNFYEQILQDFCYQPKDLSKYSVGKLFKAAISCIHNLDKLEFFILDHNDEESLKILHLAAYGKHKIRTQEREIFGIVLDKKMYRGIRAKTPINEFGKERVFLIDFGDLIEVTKDQIKYKLFRETQEIKSQAIPSRMIKVPEDKKEKIQEILQEKLNAEVSFYVCNVNNNVLEVSLVPDAESRKIVEKEEREKNCHFVGAKSSNLSTCDDLVEDDIFFTNEKHKSLRSPMQEKARSSSRSPAVKKKPDLNSSSSSSSSNLINFSSSSMESKPKSKRNSIEKDLGGSQNVFKEKNSLDLARKSLENLEIDLPECSTDSEALESKSVKKQMKTNRNESLSKDCSTDLETLETKPSKQTKSNSKESLPKDFSTDSEALEIKPAKQVHLTRKKSLPMDCCSTDSEALKFTILPAKKKVAKKDSTKNEKKTQRCFKQEKSKISLETESFPKSSCWIAEVKQQENSSLKSSLKTQSTDSSKKGKEKKKSSEQSKKTKNPFLDNFENESNSSFCSGMAEGYRPSTTKTISNPFTDDFPSSEANTSFSSSAGLAFSNSCVMTTLDTTSSSYQKSKFDQDFPSLLKEDDSSPNPVNLNVEPCIDFDLLEERRLCPFCNSLEQDCFNGAICLKDHSSYGPLDFTKEPSLNKLLEQNPSKLKTGTVLTIYPTFIISPCKFYAQIIEPGETPKQFMWEPDKVPRSQYLIKPPKPNTLVLARYTDGLWYRGRVQETDSIQLFPVFFIDYGDTLRLPYCEMALLEDSAAFIPGQAHLFNIAFLKNACDTQEELVQCVHFMNDNILYQEICVKILQQFNDETYIGFLGHVCNLAKRLEKQGFAEIAEDYTSES